MKSWESHLITSNSITLSYFWYLSVSPFPWKETYLFIDSKACLGSSYEPGDGELSLELVNLCNKILGISLSMNPSPQNLSYQQKNTWKNFSKICKAGSFFQNFLYVILNTFTGNKSFEINKSWPDYRLSYTYATTISKHWRGHRTFTAWNRNIEIFARITSHVVPLKHFMELSTITVINLTVN